MGRFRKNQNCSCWLQHFLSFGYFRGSIWLFEPRRSISNPTSVPETKEPTREFTSFSPPISSLVEKGPPEVELIFSTQSIPLAIARIPGTLLPLHSPETQSHYRCQFPSCPQIFLQKAAACTHICHDHLNIALACLYCSSKENPKMQWFSASAWESHVWKHSKEGLPIFPDDPAFTHLSPEALPSTSSSSSKSLPLDLILK